MLMTYHFTQQYILFTQGSYLFLLLSLGSFCVGLTYWPQVLNLFVLSLDCILQFIYAIIEPLEIYTRALHQNSFLAELLYPKWWLFRVFILESVGQFFILLDELLYLVVDLDETFFSCLSSNFSMSIPISRLVHERAIS